MQYDKETLEALLARDFEDIRQDAVLRQRLVSFYRYIFKKEPCGNCKKELPEYYRELKQRGVERLGVQIDRDYDFKENVLTSIAFGDSVYYSNANLTNEIAEKILRSNPNRICQFMRYPEDWKERISGKSVKASEVTDESILSKNAKSVITAIEEDDLGLDELRDLLQEERSGKDRTTVVAAIEAAIDIKLDSEDE